MTASQRSGASPTLWIGLLLIGAAIVAIAFVGQDSTEIGGFADPDGTGPEGLLALNLFVQEAGGTTETGVGFPADDIDTAILATPAYGNPFLDDPESGYDQIIDWVEAGGRLVTSVDVPGGPLGGTTFVDDDDALVNRGLCSLDALAALDQVRPLAHATVIAAPNDGQCFGEAGEAVVVSRQVGDGQIIRLASMGVFFNRALDDADNGALAARLLRIDSEPRVGFLSGPPLDLLGGGGGPVNEDGDPVGAGDQTLLELVPTKVIALLVGLAGAFLLYALSRGRRVGSPILEPIPIELPSSTYVDAVGRLYGRAEQAPQRSAVVLRTDLRNDLARRVGMSADASAQELVGAIGTMRDRQAVVDLLSGRPPTNDAELVSLAARLNTTREQIDRGGVTALLRSDDITMASDEQIVTERNTDD